VETKDTLVKSHQKLVKRILRNSEVFHLNDLVTKDVDELKMLQKQSLIELRIVMLFRNRHKRNDYLNN
jgi:hypothetical protein